MLQDGPCSLGNIKFQLVHLAFTSHAILKVNGGFPVVAMEVEGHLVVHLLVGIVWEGHDQGLLGCSILLASMRHCY